jgi:hypothetical protein
MTSTSLPHQIVFLFVPAQMKRNNCKEKQKIEKPRRRRSTIMHSKPQSMDETPTS